MKPKHTFPKVCVAWEHMSLWLPHWVLFREHRSRMVSCVIVTSSPHCKGLWFTCWKARCTPQFTSAARIPPLQSHQTYRPSLTCICPTVYDLLSKYKPEGSHLSFSFDLLSSPVAMAWRNTLTFLGVLSHECLLSQHKLCIFVSLIQWKEEVCWLPWSDPERSPYRFG